MYIIEIIDEDKEMYQYEYDNIKHAREHYNTEKHATLFEYKNGKYYIVDVK